MNNACISLLYHPVTVELSENESCEHGPDDEKSEQRYCGGNWQKHYHINKLNIYRFYENILRVKEDYLCKFFMKVHTILLYYYYMCSRGLSTI